jgi:NAD(P)-dependent dehydrogenase (short-subunit alcohol dehydrogenase family)
MSSDDFQGRTVLITGAGSGMGRLAAKRLCAAGASVAGLDLNEEGLRQTGLECERFRAWPVDVTDARAVEATVAEVESAFGPIDRVMNAAAIMPTDLIMNQDATLINRIMDINYCGTVNVTMATLPGMLERGRGDLVNFASIAGWLPAMHFGAYNASKFAVVAFTEVLYHENRKSGVRFACVCPPPVATPLLDQAKSQPKVLEGMPPIAPEKVLDAIERELARGRLMVFPDPTSRISYWLRRLTPGLMWWGSHRIEGI